MRPRPHRAPRRIRAAGALAAIALLAGCASVPPAPAWEPPAAAEPRLVIIESPSGTSSPGTAAAVAAPAAPAFDARLVYRDDPASPVAARWGEIPGNAPFTELLRTRVRDAIAEHAALTGIPWEPSADAPTLPPEQRGCVPGSTSRPAAELLADPAFTPPSAAPPAAPALTITCEILAGAGTVLVQALRILSSTGGQPTSDATTVYYLDTTGAFVTTGDTLISDDGLHSLLQSTVQSLKANAHALEPAMTQSLDEFPLDRLRADFSRFSFSADGSLVVQLPDGFSTPELDRLALPQPTGPRSITVPAADTPALLSEQGRQIQAVLASGAPLTLPTAPWRGDEAVDCAFFACVAVTFDDGPGGYTGQVLDDLAARHAAATFYVQGYRVQQNPQALRRMRDEGHEIGNHTFNHPDLTKLTDDEIEDQLGRASAAIKDAAGVRASTFRPPYGAYDDRVLAQTALPAILWTVDTDDWQIPDDATLLDRAVGGASPGAIILLHDVHQNTARMTPAVLDGLLGRGFTPVTVEQLLGRTPAPHTVTTHG